MDVVTEYCWSLQPALLDLHRHRLAPLPGRLGGAGENPPPHIQELDVPLRPLVRRHRLQLLGAGAGLELFQSEIQWCGFCELLHRVAGYVVDVCGLEGAEEDEDCGVEGDGFGDGCVSSGAGGDG